MAKVIIDIDDAILAKVLLDSQEQEISLDSFIHDALCVALSTPNTSPVRKLVDIDEIITSAIKRVMEIEPGTEFMLVELCTSEDWDALTSGERKSLGKGFRKAVEGMSSPVAKYVRRTSSNKAVYVRI